MAALALWVVPAPGAPTSLRADGTVLVNGEPFYPFGFYYDGYNIPKATRLADLATMGGAGFNVIATNIDNADEPLFNSAESLGVGVLMEFNDPNDTLLQQVDRWKSNPALFGWQISDDVDNGKKTPSAVATLNGTIKAADPAHITYASGGHPQPGPGHDTIGNFMDVTDTLAMQTYPIPNEELSATNGTLKAFANAAPTTKTLLANIQSFAWERERAPTADEARNMTYQAYINGMKGIIFYSFRTDYWNLPANASLWSQFQTLARENEVMRPWLLNGTMTRQVDTGPQRYNVFCSYWQYEGQLFIIFANVSNTDRFTAVTLPAGTNGPAVPLFPGTASGMTYNAGTRVISGPVQRGKVHVYQVGTPRQAAADDWQLFQ